MWDASDIGEIFAYAGTRMTTKGKTVTILNTDVFRVDPWDRGMPNLWLWHFAFYSGPLELSTKGRVAVYFDLSLITVERSNADFLGVY